MKLRPFFLLALLLGMGNLSAQTIGGAATYNFLRLPSAPLQTAVGGVNVSLAADELGLALNNPAMLRSSLHGQLAMNFNSFFAGIRAYQLGGVLHRGGAGITFGAGLSYIDYGNMAQTDVFGNQIGQFRPRDFSFQFSAARSYGDRIRYGLTARFIQSNYGNFRSTALAFDVGLHYNDTANGFSAGLVAQSMGAQLRSFGGRPEDLPFDLQVGISKRLAKAPFGFSLSLQQLHRFTQLHENNFLLSDREAATARSGLATRISNHLVLATHVYLGRYLEVHTGYNFLRRRELNLGTAGNGLNGFSLGFRARFSRLQFQYARAAYQRGRSYNQFGIQIPLVRKL